MNRCWRMAISLLLLLSSMLSSSVSLAEKTEKAFVRLNLIGGNEKAAQWQERRLSVKLYTDTWLRKAPQYPDIEIEGALVVRPSSFAAHSQETIDGREYIVQEQIYRVYPQRLGAFYIAPVTLSMSLAQLGSKARMMRLLSNDLIFTVEQEQEALVAADVQWQEEYRLIAGERSTALQTGETWFLQAGDVIERKITLRAARTTAVLLPNFNQLFSESYRNSPWFDESQFSRQDVDIGTIYRRVSLLEDRENRGESTAMREEIWRYKLANSGRFDIPPMMLSYWDSSDGELHSLVLPVQKLNVEGSLRWPSLVLPITFLALLIVSLWLFYTKGQSFWRALRAKIGHANNHDEPRVWHSLCVSLREQDQESFGRQFSQWSRCWSLDSGNIHSFVTGRYDLLPIYLCTPYSPDDSTVKLATLNAIEQGRLLNELQELREYLKGAIKPIAADKKLCLPPLNPSPEA